MFMYIGFFGSEGLFVWNVIFQSFDFLCLLVLHITNMKELNYAGTPAELLWSQMAWYTVKGENCKTWNVTRSPKLTKCF